MNREPAPTIYRKIVDTWTSDRRGLTMARLECGHVVRCSPDDLNRSEGAICTTCARRKGGERM